MIRCLSSGVFYKDGALPTDGCFNFIDTVFLSGWCLLLCYIRCLWVYNHPWLTSSCWVTLLSWFTPLEWVTDSTWCVFKLGCMAAIDALFCIWVSSSQWFDFVLSGCLVNLDALSCIGWNIQPWFGYSHWVSVNPLTHYGNMGVSPGLIHILGLGDSLRLVHLGVMGV